MKKEHGGNIYKYAGKVYDFSANLNPLGTPMQVRRAIVENMDAYEAYPDPKNTELRKAIAEYHGVDEGLIACGNGAEDVIYRIVCALNPENALVVAPTFSEYEEALETFGCSVDHFYLSEENDFIPDAGIAGKIDGGDYDLVFICNPNNPTGIPVPRKVMMDIIYACDKTDSMLVMDECFMDFLSDAEKYTVMGEISRLPKAIILKSFTKLFAMAGLRLGYCVCGDSQTAEKIRECLTRWPVSTVAATAGVAALSVDGYADRTKALVAIEREKLVAALIRAGFKLYDSCANYIFFRSEIPLERFLMQYGIIIRNCDNYEGIFQPGGAESPKDVDGYYYRIAVRTPAENRYLMKALSDRMHGR